MNYFDLPVVQALHPRPFLYFVLVHIFFFTCKWPVPSILGIPSNSIYRLLCTRCLLIHIFFFVLVHIFF
jgi:hypothetical protein